MVKFKKYIWQYSILINLNKTLILTVITDPCSRSVCSCLKYNTRQWWRHQMETFSSLLTICAGNSPVTGEFPAQRPVTRSFDVFFYWIISWVNSPEAGDLRCYRTHYDVTVMAWETPVHLTYWGRCHIQTPLIRVIIGSGSCLSIRHQSINWTNGDSKSTGPQRTSEFH